MKLLLFQVYDAKLSKLREQSTDFRLRLREHKARPKALESIRNSLNLSSTFMKQIVNLTDKDEIYTAKDLQEMEKINKETQVIDDFNGYDCRKTPNLAS